MLVFNFEGEHITITVRTANIPIAITGSIIQIPITTNTQTIISVAAEQRQAVYRKDKPYILNHQIAFL